MKIPPHTQYTSPPSSKSVDTESGVKLTSRSSAEQLVEPTPIGSSATRKGLRRQPMDNVIMASYQANTSSLSRTKPKTTPTRAAPTAPSRAAPPPSSRGGGGGVKQSLPRQSGSSHSLPTTADHPMTAIRAPGSRSPSQPARSITTATSGVASSSAKSNDGKIQLSSVAASGSLKGTKASSTASSSKKNAQASSDGSGKSMQASSTASGSRRGNGGKIQPKDEDILEHQESEQGDFEFEVPMDFPRDQIKLGKEFGEGDFGKVFQAEAKKLFPGQKKTMVVVKQLKEGATKEERDVFLRPVEAMK